VSLEKYTISMLGTEGADSLDVKVSLQCLRGDGNRLLSGGGGRREAEMVKEV
jgi:hypothetical protein